MFRLIATVCDLILTCKRNRFVFSTLISTTTLKEHCYSFKLSFVMFYFHSFCHIFYLKNIRENNGLYNRYRKIYLRFYNIQGVPIVNVNPWRPHRTAQD